MVKETKQDMLQQIIDELFSAGVKGDNEVTKDKISDLMAKALKRPKRDFQGRKEK